jgi:ribonuclease/clavin/mitogillin
VTLIDTGSPAPEANTFIQLLAGHLEVTGGIIRDIILTHHHIDHVGGLEAVLEYLKKSGNSEARIHKHRVPWYPSDSTIKDNELDNLVHEYSSSGEGINWLKAGDELFGEDENTDDLLEVIHTPGHTQDSISLWSKSIGNLFVGDTILGYAELSLLGNSREWIPDQPFTSTAPVRPLLWIWAIVSFHQQSFSIKTSC